MSALTSYEQFERLTFERPSEGVLLITMNNPRQYNAADARMHRELAEIWPLVSDDERTRAAVITGAGKAFSAGGDLEMIGDQLGDFDTIAGVVMKEAAAIVYNMIDCQKPIVSAINGAAVGAGLAVALLADVSFVSRTAKLADGHVRLGLAAGDHAPIIWPLLCGMAKAKYYLLNSGFISGEEAERIGLVSQCTDPDAVLSKALEYAAELAAGPQFAIRWTKYALNNWLRHAGPIFDSALALEMLNLFGADAVEGHRAMTKKSRPSFPSASEPGEAD